MSVDTINKLADQVFDAVKGFVGKTTKPLIERVTELEKKVAEHDEAKQLGMRLDRLEASDVDADGRGIVKSVEVIQDASDYRKVTRTETWSDGRKFVSTLRNDSPLFLGAFERGKSYTAGDWVVFGGTTWACLAKTDREPGSNSPEWMVAARKGRDGVR